MNKARRIVGSYGSFLKYSDISLQVLTRAILRKITAMPKTTLDDIVSPPMARIEAIRQEKIGYACTLMMNVIISLGVLLPRDNAVSIMERWTKMAVSKVRLSTIIV